MNTSSNLTKSFRVAIHSTTQVQKRNTYGPAAFRSLKPKPVNWYQRQPMYLIPIHGPWNAHDYSGLPEWIDGTTITSGQQDEPMILLEPHPEYDPWHWYLNWIYGVSIMAFLIFIYVHFFNIEGQQLHHYSQRDVLYYELERGKGLREKRLALMEEHGIQDKPLENYPTKYERIRDEARSPSF